MKNRLISLLRWSERYTKTDMVYLVSSGGWLVAEQVFAAFVTLSVGTVFGHIANKDLYGNYKYVLSLGGLLSAFSLSGIGTAITRAVAQGKEGALKQGVEHALRWSLGIPSLALLGAGYYLYTGNLFLSVSLCIVAVFAPLINSFSLFDYFLIGRREFSTSTLYSMASNVLVALGIIGAVLIEERAIYLVLAYFVINAALDGFFYVRSVRRAANNDREPGLLRYGAHLSGMTILSTIGSTIDSIVVFTFLGPAQLAVYAYAIAIPAQMIGLFKNITPLSSPKFAQRSLTEIQGGMWHRLILLAGLAAVCSLFYILAAPWIFHILFPVYGSSVTYSQLYAVSIVLMAMTYPLISALQAHQKIKELHIASNSTPLTIIVILPILAYFWGIQGVIISQVLARAVGLGVALWQFWAVTDSSAHS